MEADDILLESEVTIEVYYHCESDLLKLTVKPYNKGLEKSSNARRDWYYFPQVWVRASILFVDL